MSSSHFGRASSTGNRKSQKLFPLIKMVKNWRCIQYLNLGLKYGQMDFIHLLDICQRDVSCAFALAHLPLIHDCVVKLL